MAARKSKAKDFNHSARDVRKFLKAVADDDCAAVRRMIDQGAQIRAITAPPQTTFGRFVSERGYATGSTPLHIAALYGYAAMTGLLLKNGALANKADDDGYTPLDYAIRSHAYYTHKAQKVARGRSVIMANNSHATTCRQYADVIGQLVAAGAKPSLYPLPDALQEPPLR